MIQTEVYVTPVSYPRVEFLAAILEVHNTYGYQFSKTLTSFDKVDWVKGTTWLKRMQFR